MENQPATSASSPSAACLGWSSTGDGSNRNTPSSPGLPSSLVNPCSAALKSLGTTHTLLASPRAISGSVCRYW
ncbi:Uncharacterised protein [Mycobacterium tuberculosis]|uniref:Uncharacterized protein n=1 Tax=Mycobacterium tuberculosis TaxID=1773 RepID=A0A655DLU6_MYCTX|nr:Uncharacterised protein [Mycobacterium tuberculosis]CKQ18978.1 Uncharacterised protein [Mycobacterium tuberculosis]CKU42454.1 Uncharacterised protein [Mycobacterium tuberculosis]CNU72880.1 Uncharacterised protein [Mycobacterium tuberculosis]CNX58272.1 Uncharacterised protein [Mycobacterium tuberculosis]